jgi:hypothetical protein
MDLVCVARGATVGGGDGGNDLPALASLLLLFYIFSGVILVLAVVASKTPKKPLEQMIAFFSSATL